LILPKQRNWNVEVSNASSSAALAAATKPLLIVALGQKKNKGFKFVTTPKHKDKAREKKNENWKY
jgi:hypothetical protein